MTYSKGCKYSTWVLIDGLSERVETDLIGQPYSDGSDNDVYDLFGDDNHFPDFFSVQVFGGFRSSFYGGFDFRMICCQRQGQFKTDFSVERYRVFETVFYQEFLVPFGEYCRRNTIGMSQFMP